MCTSDALMCVCVCLHACMLCVLMRMYLLWKKKTRVHLPSTQRPHEEAHRAGGKREEKSCRRQRSGSNPLPSIITKQTSTFFGAPGRLVNSTAYTHARVAWPRPHAPLPPDSHAPPAPRYRQPITELAMIRTFEKAAARCAGLRGGRLPTAAVLHPRDPPHDHQRPHSAKRARIADAPFRRGPPTWHGMF